MKHWCYMQAKTISISAALLILLLSGCSNPKDVTLPKDLTDMNALSGLRPSLEKLESSERDLAGRFIIRHAMANGLGSAFGFEVEQVPTGMTIGQAIESQRQFESDQKAKQAQKETAAAAKKTADNLAAQKKKQLEEEISKFIVVQLMDITTHKASFHDGDFENTIMVKLAIENKSTKTIAGVKGMLTLKDSFGDVVSTSSIKFEQEIGPASDKSLTLSRRYNQFMETDRKLAEADPKTISSIFTPITIIFVDGSKIETSSQSE